MKGRSTFTAQEIERIRALLRKKARAPRSAQKEIRAQMRQLGFYISDFGAQDRAFTEKDLDRLIRSGRISISGSPRRSWWARLKEWWQERSNRRGPASANSPAVSRPLAPILTQGLDVVFVGTEPGPTSARVGHYFANPDNTFYQDLHAVGLTPRLLRPEEDRRLVEYGIGVDDVYDDPEGLRRRIEQVRPRALCFNSKDALVRFVLYPVDRWRGRDAGRVVDLPGSLVWALPDSSPRAERHHPERLRLLRQLVDALDRNRA